MVSASFITVCNKLNEQHLSVIEPIEEVKMIQSIS